VNYQRIIDRDSDNGFWFCRDCASRGYSVAAAEIHHVIHRSVARPGTAMRKLIDSPMNLISLCSSCHAEANATEKKREHLALLQREEGYEYGQVPWHGLLG